MNIGYFASFTVFLALNDADFCNKYFRSVPSEDGIVTLATYLRVWGWACATVTLLIAAFKREINFPPSGLWEFGTCLSASGASAESAGK
jgi:hypothetical protein